jgi:hypothetical protein
VTYNRPEILMKYKGNEIHTRSFTKVRYKLQSVACFEDPPNCVRSVISYLISLVSPTFDGYYCPWTQQTAMHHCCCCVDWSGLRLIHCQDSGDVVVVVFGRLVLV